MNKISNFQFPIFTAALFLSIVLPNTIQAVTYDVMLDTHDVAVNAVEGTLKLSHPGEVTNGDSVVVIWIKQPKMGGDTVEFAGITPGGFSGDVKLFSVTSEEKLAVLSQGINAIKNDGSGDSTGVNLYIKESKEKEKDRIPPQFFSITLSKDPNIFEGHSVAIFLSQDKESGVDHYEAAEVYLGSPKGEDWQIASSPYEIKDKWGIKKLYIKAVDREGNERIQQVHLENRKLPWIFVGIIVLILCALFVRRS